jgi:hypothetical protein
LLISAEGLLKVYSYFLLILVGLKLLEIAKVLLNKEPIRLRVIPELGLIAVSQKIVAEDSNAVSVLMPFWYGIFDISPGTIFYIEHKMSGKARTPADFRNSHLLVPLKLDRCS